VEVRSVPHPDQRPAQELLLALESPEGRHVERSDVIDRRFEDHRLESADSRKINRSRVLDVCFVSKIGACSG
jgi:hypothetical protein